MKHYNAVVSMVTLLLSVLHCAHISKAIAIIGTEDINNTASCHENFMAIHIAKEPFQNLQFTIYVRDEQGRHFKATDIAFRCHYFIDETSNFVLLAVPYYGCLVKRQGSIASITIVIKAWAKGGQAEINKTVPLICTVTPVHVKEKINTVGNALNSPEYCDKDGFTITIHQNATVPPLNLDTVHILSHQRSSCKPQTKASDSVTFRFPFTSCGTQFLMDHEKIIFWVKVEAQRLLTHQQEATFRDVPFRLTVCCTYALTTVSQIGIEVYREKSKLSSALKTEGILRAEMRFAKESSYSSFYSNKDLPVKLGLGKPVYVEVFLLKHEDKELELRLQDCWATSSEDPLDQLRWNLLVKGCPFIGDTHRTEVLPVVPSNFIKYPSHHKWFKVKQFAFVKPNQFQQLVYFHCDVEVCKEHDCSKPCNRSRQRLERQKKTVQKYTTVYCGPLELVL